ncbi:hypothetical protein QR680_015006 [Steinernema hermaphroditum]|uniref:G-protein coupled receptors family 1 profile domain-containing protein n=1 Tax=Steinernema hermaphroditum TaxID=289476 RepID=A0AA39IAT2_9BILA|nr:hypothetical protein QR680_015006 [Steinernema hermaphroditum]
MGSGSNAANFWYFLFFEISEYDDVRSHRLIMGVISVFGIYGNLNIIIATVRKRAFRNKSGLIICTVALYDNVSLLCSFSIIIRTFRGVVIMQHECFKTMGFCFAVQLLSICALLTLALDRLIAVSFPCWYTTIRGWVPLFFATVLGAAISIPFMTLSIVNMEPDHTIPVCSEGTALPRSLQRYGNIIFFTINISIIAIYFIAYLILFWRRASRSMADHVVSASLRIHERAMKSIAVFVFVFCFSWFLSQLLASQLRMVESGTSPVVFVLKLVMICSISFSYSHCYYVYFWTSRDYRAAFLEQLRCASGLKIFVTSNIVMSSRANAPVGHS